MDTQFPFVSVVMPIRNEESYIGRCLLSIMNQDYPMDRMEVVIADGMSTDKTRDVIREFQQRYRNIILLDNPGKIVPTGYNNAVCASHGEFILRVDGHSELAPNYLTICTRYLARGDTDVVGGSMETVGETMIGKAIAQASSSKFGVGASFRADHRTTKYVDTIAFAAFRRDMIQKAGLYDEEMKCNEDDEYFYRIRKMGFRIMLASEAQVRYFGRSSLIGLWRQYYRYGLWKVRVLQKHPRQMRPRQFVPGLFVLTLFLSGLFTPFSLLASISLLSLFTLYLVANIIASLWVANSSKWSYLPALPLIFFILHFSYGIGFLMGLFQFLDKWGDLSPSTILD